MPIKWDQHAFSLHTALPVGTKASLTRRDSIIWVLPWPEGEVLVEWAPLPGLHQETLETHLPQAHEVVALAFAEKELTQPLAPSLRCLYADVCASRRWFTLPPLSIPMAGLIDLAAGISQVVEQQQQLSRKGITAVKLKCGKVSLPAAKELLPLFSGWQFRLDFNDAWDRASLSALLQDFIPTFIEGYPEGGDYQVPLGYDAGPWTASYTELLRDHPHDVLVHKRSVVGCDHVLSEARLAGKKVCFSTAFESPLGLSYSAALMHSHDLPAGFGHLLWLSDSDIQIDKGVWHVQPPLLKLQTEEWKNARAWRH